MVDYLSTMPNTTLLTIFVSYREGATEVVEEYFDRIGGRPQPPGKQAPGRKRKSMSEAKSTPEPKKTKKPRGVTNGTETSSKKDAPVSIDDDERDISPDDWEEKDVDKVETIVPDQKGNLYAYAQFKNGKSVKIAIEQCYKKMPMKVSRQIIPWGFGSRIS